MPTPAAARLAAMQMQALHKQPRKAGGQVSTARPSLASGCLHSMNDKAESAQATLLMKNKTNWDQSGGGIFNRL